jgi:hypothetical protein
LIRALPVRGWLDGFFFAGMRRLSGHAKYVAKYFGSGLFS